MKAVAVASFMARSGLCLPCGQGAMGATKQRRRAQRLDTADFLTLRATEGWLELGDGEEAIRELGRVSRRGRWCREVLQLRWRILGWTGKWEACLALAREWTRRHPEDAQGWIALAETLYQLKQVRKAYRVASAKAAEFPESSALLYDAGCYACLVAKFEEAEWFFQLAAMMSGAPSIQLEDESPVTGQERNKSTRAARNGF
jgi:hypothetical protein